jgi:DNA polymerase III subunit gamma/tau
VNLPLALKYRPSSFKEVIGQGQVTESLMSALSAKQIHHAYLFSGPRGCGKTSSARILARSLNCEKGPIADPCGECQSCTDLIANGPGSLDVIEMDAATHGLVDDARELRDKALFAPVQSRYKIYIIDEAHQLGPAAANALLKIVEEPPPYVIFIFATTEPEKVIPTIRSRTHHYQFRLVDPEALSLHLAEVSRKEGIGLEDGVVSLAVRAGNGSVRDSLSALGQLLNGAIEGKVSQDAALRLLGQTSNQLLDDVVDALVHQNASRLLQVIYQLLEVGQDARRFTLDLLDRFRDLMVLNATNGDKTRLLRSYSLEETQRLQAVASKIPISALISATEIISEHLDKLRTAVSTQITLETMMMRLINFVSTQNVEAPKAPEVNESSKPPHAMVEEMREIPKEFAEKSIKPVEKKVTNKIPLSDLKILQNNWPRVLEEIKHRRRLTWTLLSSQSEPSSFESGVVQVSLPSGGALDSFERSNSSDVLLAAMKEIFDGQFTVEMVIKGRQPAKMSKPADMDISESSDQMIGEALLMKELGAQVISKEEQ